MSANATAAWGAGFKAVRATKKRCRLVVAVSLIVQLSGTAVPAGSEEGPAASAPLPPPLPAAPPATGLQQPQGTMPSEASRRVLPQSHPHVERAVQASHLRKPNNDPDRVDHSTRAARGEKRLGRHLIGDVERAEAHSVPRVASTMTPPLAPLPFPFGYFPSAPPAYQYAPVYPPPWPPGPVVPR
jgi:hypothetical protein